ncbi:MAG: hydrogenase maturation protease [Thermoleophilia bacterium]
MTEGFSRGAEGGDNADRNIQMLVLGVGNDMMGDEGVGVRIARQLNNAFVFPAEVEVVDGGVGGTALLPLIRSAAEVVIVDAVDRDARPGSIFMFNSEEMALADGPQPSGHDDGIIEAINGAARMGEQIDAMIIGVQPKRKDAFGSDLSKPVTKNVNRVIEIILDLLAARGLSPELKGTCSMVNPAEWDRDA